MIEVTSAAEVLKKYWDGKLPVRPDRIAKSQGIAVYEALMKGSGQIQLNAHGKYEIFVNEQESSTRNRFTIAHELGHYNLGHMQGEITLCRDFPTSYAIGNPDPREKEANDFAASLLMPEDAVRYVLQHGHARTIEDLKKMFGVSETAMRFRLKNLGYM